MTYESAIALRVAKARRALDRLWARVWLKANKAKAYSNVAWVVRSPYVRRPTFVSSEVGLAIYLPARRGSAKHRCISASCSEKAKLHDAREALALCKRKEVRAALLNLARSYGRYVLSVRRQNANRKHSRTTKRKEAYEHTRNTTT